MFKCVIPCYLQHINANARCLPKLFSLEEKWKTLSERQNYFNCFPYVNSGSTKKDCGDYWDDLSVLFYQKIWTDALSVFPVVTTVNEKIILSMYPPLKENGIEGFIYYHNYEQSFNEVSDPALLEALKKAKMPVDIIPEKVVNSFYNSGKPLLFNKPALTREFLRRNKDNVLKSKHDEATIATLLEYCISENYEPNCLKDCLCACWQMENAQHSPTLILLTFVSLLEFS